MKFTIDRIENTDVSDVEIFDLLSKVYVQAGFTTPEVAASLFEPTKVKSRGILFVSRESSTNELAGMVILVPAYSQASVMAKEGECEMHLLGVYPKYRGLGLGRSLVEKAICLAKERGLKKIILWTQKPMNEAQGLYISLGFISCGEMVRNGIEYLLFDRECI
ncbi:MAG: GNAT family N-acetyltransferase [Candidatus Thiodiazotropha sp.]